MDALYERDIYTDPEEHPDYPREPIVDPRKIGTFRITPEHIVEFVTADGLLMFKAPVSLHVKQLMYSSSHSMCEQIEYEPVGHGRYKRIETILEH